MNGIILSWCLLDPTMVRHPEVFILLLTIFGGPTGARHPRTFELIFLQIRLLAKVKHLYFIGMSYMFTSQNPYYAQCVVYYK